ncbi:unnamed protein product, partial [Rotaria magnacalcarata]
FQLLFIIIIIIIDRTMATVQTLNYYINYGYITVKYKLLTIYIYFK